MDYYSHDPVCDRDFRCANRWYHIRGMGLRNQYQENKRTVSKINDDADCSNQTAYDKRTCESDSRFQIFILRGFVCSWQVHGSVDVNFKRRSFRENLTYTRKKHLFFLVYLSVRIHGHRDGERKGVKT
jgi:hypothetical protein